MEKKRKRNPDDVVSQIEENKNNKKTVLFVLSAWLVVAALIGSVVLIKSASDFFLELNYIKTKEEVLRTKQDIDGFEYRDGEVCPPGTGSVHAILCATFDSLKKDRVFETFMFLVDTVPLIVMFSITIYFMKKRKFGLTTFFSIFTILVSVILGWGGILILLLPLIMFPAVLIFLIIFFKQRKSKGTS